MVSVVIEVAKGLLGPLRKAQLFYNRALNLAWYMANEAGGAEFAIIILKVIIRYPFTCVFSALKLCSLFQEQQLTETSLSKLIEEWKRLI